jgi:hypothetical protein
MNSFDQLISQLNKFSKKYHAVSAVKGGLIFSCYSIVLLFTIGLLEFFLNFSSYGRIILFYGVIIVLSIFFFTTVFVPVLRFFGLMKRLDHISAAKLIGDEIPEVGDKLINTIQLSKQDSLKNSGDLLLLSASIKQRSKELSTFSFSNATSFKKNKRFLLAFIMLLVMSSLITVLKPEFIFHPLSRVVNFNDSFLAVAPYEFIVNNNSELKVLENANLDIVIKTQGSSCT